MRLNTWQQIRGNRGKLWENNKKDDSMKEQAPFPSHHRVNKQGQLMGQSDRGVDHKTVDISDYELIPTPQGLSKWRKLKGVSKNNTHPFTHDMTCERENIAPHRNKDSTPYSFHGVFLHFWWRRLINATNNTYITFMVDRLQYLMSLNLKCFCN
jgi:hypothetical protein